MLCGCKWLAAVVAGQASAKKANEVGMRGSPRLQAGAMWTISLGGAGHDRGSFKGCSCLATTQPLGSAFLSLSAGSISVLYLYLCRCRT